MGDTTRDSVPRQYRHIDHPYRDDLCVCSECGNVLTWSYVPKHDEWHATGGPRETGEPGHAIPSNGSSK